MWRISLAVVTFVLVAAPRAHCADDNAPLPPPQQLVRQNLQELETILEDPKSTETQREDAARRLVSRQSPQSRQILLRVLTAARDNADAVRLPILRALTDDASPDAPMAAQLQQFLTDRTLADAAVSALGRYAELGDANARQSLLREAQNANQALAIRESAIKALGRVPDRSVADALVNLLNDPRPPVHNAADDALVELTGLTANGRDDSKWQRWAAAHAAMNNDQWLADVLQTRNQYKTEQAQQALESIKAHTRFLERLYADAQKQKNDALSNSLILQSLNDPDPSLKIWGINAVLNRFSLNQAYPPEAQARITELIGDEDPKVRIAAAGTLDRLNPPGALKALITQTAQEPDPQVKIALVSSLGRLRDSRAIPVLERLLSDKDIGVVTAAANALQAIAANTPLDKQVSDDLWKAQQKIQAANPPNAARLRAALIDAMGRLSDQEHAEQYRQLLNPNESPPEVRSAAFHALGELHDARRTRQMTTALQEEQSPEVRAEALEGLGEIGNFEEVAPTLFTETTDNEPSKLVRDKAWDVFQRTLPLARNSEVLTQWVQRFEPQPERQIFVLDALCAKLQRDAQKETDRDAQAKLLDNLAVEQAKTGDVYMKLNQPERAATEYQKALRHWEPLDQPANASMIPLTLVRQIMTASLAANDYDGAAKFAHEEMAHNSATVRDISTAIRNEVDRLDTQGQRKDALALIERGQSIKDPPLFQLDLDYLQQLKEKIERARPGT